MFWPVLVSEDLPGDFGQAKSIIEFTKSEQTSVGRHSRTMEFQLEAGIEGHPEDSLCFTRCIDHVRSRLRRLSP